MHTFVAVAVDNVCQTSANRKPQTAKPYPIQLKRGPKAPETEKKSAMAQGETALAKQKMPRQHVRVKKPKHRSDIQPGPQSDLQA